MRRAALAAVPACLAGALLAPAFGSSAPLAIGDDTGAKLLARAAAAARELDYQGTQFVTYWAETGTSGAVVEINHKAGEGSIVKIAPTPQSEGGIAFHEEGADDGADTVQLGPDALELMKSNYETVVEGPDSVAGRPADIVAVRHPGQSPVARYWLDRDTRLVLRRETFDADGRTLSASAYIRVELAAGPFANTVAMPRTATPTGSQLNLGELAVLGEAGWQVPETLPGDLRLYNARTTSGEQGQVLHLSYSDGVSRVSLFEEEGDLDTGSLDGWERAELGGATVWIRDEFPRRVVWAGAGKVYTVVAECQQPVLEGIIGALPHSEPDSGVLDRVGRGMARVGSWFNPFG